MAGQQGVLQGEYAVRIGDIDTMKVIRFQVYGTGFVDARFNDQLIQSGRLSPGDQIQGRTDDKKPITAHFDNNGVVDWVCY